MSLRSSAVSFLLAIAGAAPTHAAERIGSAFTRYDYTACRLVEHDGPAETRRCAGYAGIPVEWNADDDGSMVAFGRDGLVGAPLGRDFTGPSGTIEWRGPMSVAGIRPYAAIVRMDVGQSIAGPFRSRLVVFRLAGRTSCIAAIIDGRRADANLRARDAADRIAPTFECGVGAPAGAE